MSVPQRHTRRARSALVRRRQRSTLRPEVAQPLLFGEALPAIDAPHRAEVADVARRTADRIETFKESMAVPLPRHGPERFAEDEPALASDASAWKWV